MRTMLRSGLLSLTALILLGLIPHTARAATINVPADQPTIQAAINAASNGDTVLVAPGTYHENINFMGKAITVTSSGGPSVTTINGGAVGSVVSIDTSEGTNSVLSGFTIRNGSAPFGAGITLLGTSPTILGNIFDGNAQGAGGYGAGVGGNGASPKIENNLFKNNTCDEQYLSGVVSFINTSSPIIANNIFVNNPCRAIDMTLPQGSAPVVINNVMVENYTGVRVDTRVSAATQIYENNIIANNTIGLMTEFGTSADNPTWSHNLVFGNGTDYQNSSNQTGLNGNISADPLFVNAASNFHVQSGSPVIDAGDDAAPNLPLTDFDGNSRIVDGNNDGAAIVDMGAYEFFPTTDTVSPTSLTFGSQRAGATSPPQTVTVTNTGTQKLLLGITVDTNFGETDNCGSVVGPGAACSINVTFSPATTGTFNGNLTIRSNAAGSPQTASLTGVGVSASATAITSYTPNPSNLGQPVTVSFSVTGRRRPTAAMPSTSGARRPRSRRP